VERKFVLISLSGRIVAAIGIHPSNLDQNVISSIQELIKDHHHQTRRFPDQRLETRDKDALIEIQLTEVIPIDPVPPVE
jgi:hypothetical protein